MSDLDRYLLVSHIPLAPAPEGGFRIGDLWLRDLRAQATALRSEGFELVLAAPLTERLREASSSGFRQETILPGEEEFVVTPLGPGGSGVAFARGLPRLRRRLVATLEHSAVLHCGPNGHPFPIGYFAWGPAGRRDVLRIFVFDGSDPFPRLEREAEQEHAWSKRLAKRLKTRLVKRFCVEAIPQADLLFTHNAAVIDRFRAVWHERCHAYSRSFVSEDLVASSASLAERQRALRARETGLRVATVGRQIRIKATDHVIQALAHCREFDGRALSAVVIGEGANLAEFRSLAAELDLADAVHFTGSLAYGPELFEAWQQSDVTAIPNLTAELSRNVLLSMAQGIPVVAYSNPGSDALLEESGAGVVVRDTSAEGLARTLLDLDRDRDRLAEMSARGVEYARGLTLEETHRSRARRVREALEARPGRG